MGLFGRKRIKQPVDGHATIVDCWLRNKDGASGNCRMKLELDVPGVERQIVDHHEPAMTYNRWPEVGMRVAVTVDANHPDRVDVHWDSVFGELLGGPVLGRAAELASGLVGVDMDLSLSTDRGPTEGKLPDDQIPARIDELNAQFRAGEISYEEMAAQIQRALGA